MQTGMDASLFLVLQFHILNECRQHNLRRTRCFWSEYKALRMGTLSYFHLLFHHRKFLALPSRSCSRTPTPRNTHSLFSHTEPLHLVGRESDRRGRDRRSGSVCSPVNSRMGATCSYRFAEFPICWPDCDEPKPRCGRDSNSCYH